MVGIRRNFALGALKYVCDYGLSKKEGDQGWDLRSMDDYILEPSERCLISTGLFLELPEGLYADVRPRSGLSSMGIDVCLGLIDSSYRGEIKVCMINNSKSYFFIHPGDRIAQLVFGQEILLNPVQVYEISSDTFRGEKGFGSSGI